MFEERAKMEIRGVRNWIPVMATAVIAAWQTSASAQSQSRFAQEPHGTVQSQPQRPATFVTQGTKGKCTILEARATNPFKMEAGVTYFPIENPQNSHVSTVGPAKSIKNDRDNYLPVQADHSVKLVNAEVEDTPSRPVNSKVINGVYEPNKLRLSDLPKSSTSKPLPDLPEKSGAKSPPPSRSTFEVPKSAPAILPTMPQQQVSKDPPKSVADLTDANSLYRPIAAMMVDSTKPASSTNTVWAMESVKVGSTPPTVPAPVIGMPNSFANQTVEAHTDSDRFGLYWDNGFEVQSLPMARLLWSVPLASPIEPKSFAKFTNASDESTIDTAIGGQFGIVRWAPVCRRDEGFQIDCFATVLSRFDEQRRLNVADFRWGLPFTMKKGNWSYKIAYEHTSSHIGDENPQFANIPRVTWAKDEIVVGISHRFWDMLRVYGQAGYAVSTSAIMSDDRDRYDMGIEWVPFDYTDWRGAPFAALDVQFRSEHDFNADTTFQVGWMFKPVSDGGSARIAFEAYNGRSPYGQLFRTEEDWLGIIFTIDW